MRVRARERSKNKTGVLRESGKARKKMLFIVQGERGIYTSVQKDWRRR